MTPLDQLIEESQRVCDAATEGPWLNHYNRLEVFQSLHSYPHVRKVKDVGRFVRFEDGDFAAHARTALPAALQHLREVVAKNESLTDDRGLLIIKHGELARRVAELESELKKWNDRHLEDMSYHGGNHASKLKVEDAVTRIGPNESLIPKEPKP